MLYYLRSLICFKKYNRIYNKTMDFLMRNTLKILLVFVFVVTLSTSFFAAMPEPPRIDDSKFWSMICENETFRWIIAEDNTAIIVGCNNLDENVTTITIPAKLDGYKVSGAGVFLKWGDYGYDDEEFDDDFEGLEPVTYEEDQDKVDTILVDPANEYLTSVDGVLFSKDKTTLICYPPAKKQTTYTVPDTTKYIFHEAFSECKQLTNIILPSGLQEIGYMCFEDCKNLSSISLPDSLTKIWGWAFEETKLSTITLPKNLTFCPGSVFDDCENLSSISVAKGNTKFVAQNGVLFSADKKTLIKYPAGKTGVSYSVPVGVETIGKWAFEFSTGLTSVSFPNTLKRIEESAFEEAEITSVTFPASVTYLGPYSFGWCPNLTKEKVTFLGEIPEGAEEAFDFDIYDYSDEKDFDYEDYGWESEWGWQWGYIITGYHGSDTCVRIPKRIDNTYVVAIDNHAFRDAQGEIKKIVIPTYVDIYAIEVFCDIPSLEEISVFSSNSNLKAVDGVLYRHYLYEEDEEHESVERTSLLCYPPAKPGKTFTIPSGTHEVMPNAFNGVSDLTEMIIPASVERLEFDAIHDCDALSIVRIENSSIRSDDFWNCDNITKVYFPNGLPEETFSFWNSDPTIYVDDFGEDDTYWGYYPVVYTRIPTPKSIQILGEDSAKSGEAIQLTAIALLDDNREKEIEATWEITYGSTYGSVSQSGLLSLGNFTGKRAVTVKATYSVNEKSFTATKTISVIGLTNDPIAISGDTFVAAGGSLDLTAVMTYFDGSTIEIYPTWELISGNNVATITEDGHLSVADVKKNTPIGVKASYEFNDQLYTQDFTIDAQPQVFNNSEMEYTYILQPGWQLVAIVLKIDDESKERILALHPYSIDSEKSIYLQMEDIEGGNSCWIHVEEETPLTITGTPMGALR